jgi:hypothetical protein
MTRCPGPAVTDVLEDAAAVVTAVPTVWVATKA